MKASARVRRTPALTANAVEVDVVAHDMGDVDCYLLVRKGGQAHLSPPIDHADGIVHGMGRTRTFEHVVDPLAAIEPAHGSDGVLVAHIYNVVGAKLQARPQPVVARARED